MLNVSAERVSGEYHIFALKVSLYGIFIRVGAGKLMCDVIYREDTPRDNALISLGKTSGAPSPWHTEKHKLRGWWHLVGKQSVTLEPGYRNKE